MTSPVPTPQTTDPDRPEAADQAALYDALAVEHAAIYGYGIVSAHSLPIRNELVSETLAQHRERREALVARMTEESVPVPLPAAGYQLPNVVATPVDAVKLAVTMENDCAVAWRAVLEQSGSEQDRTLAVTALTQCAVTAARWRRVLGAWPVTRAFPGGSE